MKKVVKIFIMALCLVTMFVTPCEAQKKEKKSKGTSYRTSTSFHMLQQGMTKQQFETWMGLNDGDDYVGKRPAKSHSYRNGDDVWEVWAFEVYKFRQEQRWMPGNQYMAGYYYYVNVPYIDHYEYVAFRNGRLEEWGQGEGRRYY